ncbi:ATP-binding protein [Ascidiimonas sp. W6]|uniref:PAS domain-containing sensor histidine kinase n=1 Tax=Ascidiimonas meishanensis TaxID=3128903 RepID=UPI0030ED0756
MFESGQDIFNILSEAIPEGLLMVDDNQNIVSVNSACLKIFGYAREALINQKLSILIPNRYHANHGGHFKGFFHNSERRQMGEGRELFGLKRSGKEFPIEVGLAPFTIYGKSFVLALLVDITQRKETESKILELNERLEDKIKIRTSELHETIAELEIEVEKRKKAEAQALESLKAERELNELKTKFLSMVSHEFKTPLTGILTSTRLATKYIETGNVEKQQKHLNTIANKVHYLNDILNDFLSVERFESGKIKYHFTHFELSKVLNEVVYDSNMLLKSGQSINYPENTDDFTLYFDQKILELLLFNLIRNAIKYSPENTTIDLTVEEKDSKLIFTVTDEGIGIPEKDQKHIFERYFRAQNASLDQGTGIGLNIVKGHLESLGGSIYFSSKENIGSKFTIEIPIKSALLS